MKEDFVSQFEREDRITSADSLFSLHDIVARRVAVHWDEAVAIVEELCNVAIGSSGETAPVPDLDDVLIGSDGHVALRSIRGEKSPTAAGRMLHTLLSGGDVPMPLRLFVSQSTSRDTHQSLQEFARGLAYFSKPNRERLIRDVYARCAQTGPQTATSPPEPPPLPKSVDEPTAESDRQLKPKRKSFKRRLLAAAAFALALSAAWLSKSGRPAHDVQATAARALSDATNALASLGQQVRNTLSPSTATPASPAAESADERERSGTKRRASSSAKTNDVEHAPLVSRRIATPKSAGAWQLAATVPNAVSFESAAVYDSPTTPLEQSALYSSADLDVEPPALLFPQLTPPLTRPGTPGVMVNRMVLVVSPEGTVERVQLVEGPARMVDVMLLSGAKTWRFTPALKDGEPVRYRTVISWTAVE